VGGDNPKIEGGPARSVCKTKPYITFTIVNEEANEMLNCAPSGSLQELARALMRLNALWTDVYNRVDHYSQLFSTSDNQCWRVLLARETG
jgi:hypothetical protein